MDHEPTSINTPPPLAEVVLAASKIEGAEPEADITGLFAHVRQSFWQFIEVADDPNAYVLAWNMIDKYAQADLIEYQVTGNTDALERLKYKVNYAVELL
ncbi:hypothetical protein [Spirosoma aerolatum]|uniref:hypothetical protein n=1 Tax=Spirosoma aerolatum TaxID=1211326 RepID=UPI0009ABBAFE|nr:hypothetical protein [Spirosoma aerolatum]